MSDPYALCPSLRPEGARSAPSSGLVLDSTSRTGLRNLGTPLVVVDTRLSRLKRMRYNVIADATRLDLDSRRGGFRVDTIFVTLTYRTGDLPEPKHVSDYLQRLRQWLKRRGELARYLWVGEMQQRGVLHYHVIVWLPHGYKLPMPDKSGWWPHGMSQIKRARAAVGYLAHYAGKLKTKADGAGISLPKGFRISGVGGLDAEDRMARAWANLPGYIRSLFTPQDRVRRCGGGGWIARETREFIPSMFRIGRIVKAGGTAFVSIYPAFREGISLCSQ